jgi:hypothetical protein
MNDNINKLLICPNAEKCRHTCRHKEKHLEHRSCSQPCGMHRDVLKPCIIIKDVQLLLPFKE